MNGRENAMQYSIGGPITPLISVALLNVRGQLYSAVNSVGSDALHEDACFSIYSDYLTVYF